MKCCASPTTYTDPSVARSATSRLESAREAAAGFEALLIAQTFGPLAKALGPYGDIVVGAASQVIARSERGGLTDRFASMLTESAEAGDRSNGP